LALAVLIDGQTAVVLVVRRLDVAAEVAAVDLDTTRRHGALVLGRHSLAELVGQDESRLVLAVQVAAQLERAMPLGSVREDGDGEQVVPDGELAADEDGPGGDGELVLASPALVDAPRRVAVDLRAATLRAIGLPVIGRSPDAPESLPGFLICHARNLSETQGAGCGCKEEVLGHLPSNPVRMHRI
jgi:hypothetical protein